MAEKAPCRPTMTYTMGDIRQDHVFSKLQIINN